MFKRSAALEAQGAKAKDPRRSASNNIRLDIVVVSSIAESTAMTPKIRVGTKNGKTRRESRKPPLRTPNVKAAPIEPIRVKTKVPNNIESTSIP